MTLPDAIKTLMPSMMVGNGTTMSSGQHRMDLHGGLPFWLVRNGLGPDYPRLEEEVRTDVVIVGGGITGAGLIQTELLPHHHRPFLGANLISAWPHAAGHPEAFPKHNDRLSWA